MNMIQNVLTIMLQNKKYLIIKHAFRKFANTKKCTFIHYKRFYDFCDGTIPFLYFFQGGSYKGAILWHHKY